jgi:hypothetical protein
MNIFVLEITKAMLLLIQDMAFLYINLKYKFAVTILRYRITKTKNGLSHNKIKTTKYVFGGDGGNRTHVQKHRHLSVYERSRYIRKFTAASAYRRASVQLV